MMHSFSEFKFFQTFRIPVESGDGLRFSFETWSNQGKEQNELVQDARLIDISVKGLGFESTCVLSLGCQLNILLHYKKLNLEVQGKVVRVLAKEGKNREVFIYGVELESDDEMKKLIELYVNGLSEDRLKDDFLAVTLQDRFSTAFEGVEVFSLLLSVFQDMTRVVDKNRFVNNLLDEACRVMDGRGANFYLVNTEMNALELSATTMQECSLNKFDYRMGIPGRVFTSGLMLNLHFSPESTDYLDELEKQRRNKVKSLIACPVYNRDEKIIGIVEIINKIGGNEHFGVGDEKNIKLISQVLSSVFHEYNPVSDATDIRRFNMGRERKYALIGSSIVVECLRECIVKLKDLSTSILFQGPKGVGKTLMAKIIHTEGNRGIGPFEVIPCGGQTLATTEKLLFGDMDTPNVLERCRAGCFFLYEVFMLPLEMQEHLHQLLAMDTEKNGNHARLMASSSIDLEALTDEGKFYRPLYEYLSRGFVRIMPLRERVEDIKPLLNFFLKLECRRQGLLLKSFSKECIEQLEQYDWPGNVEELKQCVARAVLYNPKNHVITKIENQVLPLVKRGRVVAARPVLFEDLPYLNERELDLKSKMALIERRLILAEIKRWHGNKSRASQELGLSREAVRKKLMMADKIIAKLSGKEHHNIEEVKEEDDGLHADQTAQEQVSCKKEVA